MKSIASKYDAPNTKEKLVIVVDENKIASYGKEFIKRMTSIGFDIIEGELYGEEKTEIVMDGYIDVL